MPTHIYRRGHDIAPQLQDILRRNGLQAHITNDNDGKPQLTVVGHDSPILTYDLNDKQIENLTNWGSAYANKKAYNTLTGIIGKDFRLPANFTVASEAFSKVATGLHGYRLYNSRYGSRRFGYYPLYTPHHRYGRGWAGDFLAWSPRFGRSNRWMHLRRDNGVIVAERPDGRMRPGEMKSGSYGFYYKGNKKTSQEVLDNMSVQEKFPPLKAAPRPEKGQAKPYSEAIYKGSKAYFTNEAWMTVLASHGIVIDTKEKKMTVMSSNTKVNTIYELKDEELKKITAAKIEGKNGVSIQKRLDTINDILKDDYANKVTMDSLQSKEIIDINLKPEVREVLEARFIAEEKRLQRQQEIEREVNETEKEYERIRLDPNAINGRDIQHIMGDKAFFQPVSNGRIMLVEEIRVDKTPENTFLMSAVINGTLVTHAITEKEYNKFLDLDDKHQMMMFDEKFPEVSIKDAQGFNYDLDRTVSPSEQKKQDLGYINSNSVDGRVLQELNDRKGFYRERAHGREVQVENISVLPDEKKEGQYKMTAVINGQTITHEITQAEYDKFMTVNDMQRLKLFSKIFNEVDMKTKPGQGVNIGAAILAAVVTAGDMVREGVAFAGAMRDMHHRPPRPEIYVSHQRQSYCMPGVVSPQDIAEAHFQQSMMLHEQKDNSEGMGRGL